MIADCLAENDTLLHLMRRLLLSLITVLSLSPVARGDAYRPLDHLWKGTRDLVRTDSLVLLGAGTVATIAAMTQDDDVKDYFDGKDRLGGIEKFGNFWGTGIPGAGLAVSFLGYGLLSEKDFFVQAGVAHLEALAVSTAVVFGMKYSVRRPRPNNGPRESFPSGHTSMAFATAGNMWGMHGPAAGVPAIALGMLTAASRMAVSMHYLSDTVAGATLGFVIGYAFTQHHQQSNPGRISFLPYFEDRSHFGFILSIKGDT